MPLRSGRRRFLRTAAAALGAAGAAGSAAVAGPRPAAQAPTLAFPKIDVHTHISTDAAYLREVMDELQLKMLTVCNEGLKVERLRMQIDAAVAISRAHPRYYAWCTTFGFDGMYERGWTDQVVAGLERDFARGALAVKVWKEIGMQLKDPAGRFVQIDDPIFEPILAAIARAGRTLLAHIGDPVRSWLTTDAAGRYTAWYTEGETEVRNRVGAFQGEVSYDTLIRARDRVLARHPTLRVVGCHLGSMEHDVDEVARRLDRFPNFAVETSAALNYLLGQSREKVRAFFTRYQDRILYGADISGGLIPTRYLIDMSKVHGRWTDAEIAREKQALLDRYRSDLAAYATDGEIPRRDSRVRGLALPEPILQKLFHGNATRWIPGIDASFG
jgi:hypothetical protein